MSGAPAPYPIPARRNQVDEVIQRSRFLTILAHAPDAEAARRFVDGVRDAHPDATHHCWAFVAGPPGSTRSIGMSDDGEPHGTAGRPMLTALLHSGVGEVAAVCVRWYGGTKLGTGGLSRAYSGGVKAALEGLALEMRTVRVELQATVGYAHVEAVRRLCERLGAEIRDEVYGAEVVMQVAVPAAEVEAFAREVAELTAGSGVVRILPE